MDDPQKKMPLADKQSDWIRALKASSPVAMGYAPAGIAFGVLASVAGIPWWISILISIIAFSGAAQYAAIPLIEGGAGVLNISVSTFVINLRHVFYALPLLNALPQNRAKKAYCLFTLTDECFSVMTTLPTHEQKILFFKIGFLVHAYWVVATILGIIAGETLANLIPNLSFALACLFVILWFEQVSIKKIWWPSGFALIAFIIALWIAPQYILLVALIISIMLILVRSLLLRQGRIS